MAPTFRVAERIHGIARFKTRCSPPAIVRKGGRQKITDQLPGPRAL